MHASIAGKVGQPALDMLKQIPHYFSQPFRLVRKYDRSNFQPDVIAGLTVAVVLLPQAIAFALIAELPPQMGLYTAIIGAVIAALWGSGMQMQTGPTNALSLLVLSVLLTVAEPGTSDFIMAAGVVAVMVGLFQLFMGLARLGVLVNFVSHSVIVGFSSGAGVLIAINQMRRLLGLEIESRNILGTLQGVAANIFETHWPTAVIGIGVIVLLALLRQFAPKLPGPLLAMVVSGVAVFLFDMANMGVVVLGELPSGLPPLTPPTLDFELISELSTGALAVGAIGLVQTVAISRAIATQTGQRPDSNQEFVGQGLANVAVGFFSGYASAASFSSSAVSQRAGARSWVAAVVAGLFVLIATLVFGSLAQYLPQAALAGVLIVTAYGMIDREEIARIWRGTRGDAIIMLTTFLGTLFLPLEFAVLVGILLSFAFYIMRTSVPKVEAVQPDAEFKHFVPCTSAEACPQLGILDVQGDLYFGAVTHVEEAVRHHMARNSEQRYLLIRMHRVNQCDFSGIHTLESIVSSYRDMGGDVFFVRTADRIIKLMKSTEFYNTVGEENFLSEEEAIGYLFHKILDPAICIYECELRAFKECQNLPKLTYTTETNGRIPLSSAAIKEEVPAIEPRLLQARLQDESRQSPLILDVREPREYKHGHIPQAELMPLPTILSGGDGLDLPADRDVVFICTSGRRSRRAAYLFRNRGHQHASYLAGGMRGWEAAGLLEAVEL